MSEVSSAQASSDTEAQQMALMRFNGLPFLPTVLHRTGGWDHDKGLLYDRFRLVPELDARTRPLNTYRQFKSDLLLADRDLNSNDRRRWGMLDRRSSEGRDAEVQRVVSGRSELFNPVHAAEVFLYRLASASVRRAREMFPDAESIRVHFTVPAYEHDGQAGRDAKAASERYREHLRAAVRAFAERPEFSGVEFRLVSGTRSKQWLYEPYGVYYYYAAVENRIPIRQAGATYLIVDMGGSTTDLAVVQVNKRGTEFQQYPTCASINLGGSHFDRFLLERLAGQAFRDSAADLEEALAQVERAKIEIAGGADEAMMTTSKRRYTLTRAQVESALGEFWTRGRGGQSLKKEVLSFVRAVKAKAEQHRYFHAFDTFSGIFLAGGSMQLPGLKARIEHALSELGVIAGADAAFAMPQEGVFPSSVTALGLAAEVARVDPLERATEVRAHISDDFGHSYGFALRGLGDGRDVSETLVYSKALLHSRVATTDGWTNVRRTADGKDEYTRVRVPGNRVPRHLRIRLRNDLEEEYQHDDVVPVTHFSPVTAEAQLWASFSNHFKLLTDGQGVRVKPILLLHEGSGADAKTIRLRHASKDAPHTRRNYDVSLKPGPVDGDVHICIDFGMSNTSVALMAPGRPLPAADDLQIFAVGEGLVRHQIQVPGLIVVGLPQISGEPVPSLPPEKNTNGEEVPEVVVPAAAEWEALKAEVARLQALVNASQGAVAAPVDAIVSAVRSETDAMERALTRTVEGFRAELVRALSRAAERGAPAGDAAPPAVAHPADRVMEEWLAGGPLQHPRAAADLTAKLGDEGSAPVTAEERFARFMAAQHPDIQYEPHVVRAVLAECESDDARLVVLAGPPGTGKSQLVRLLAEFYNQTLAAEDLAQLYLLQPVSPSWYSPASLQGGYSEVEGRFRDTPFLTHVLRAELHFDECTRAGDTPRLFFVCLDEFNLAQPEQYMADVLSRMEAPAGSPQRTLTLCRRGEAPGLTRDITARLTPNLKIFATINVDASTHFLSPKVLDRSHFVRLRPTAEGLRRVSASLAARHAVPWFHAAFGSLLDELHLLSDEARTPLGYRVLERAYRYAAFASPGDAIAVVDHVLSSFVLSRLPGVFTSQSREYRKRVEAVERACRAAGYASAAVILRRIGDGVPGQAV